MVTQKRILFGPLDILRVRIACKACGGEITFPVLQKKFRLAPECPHCNNEWNRAGSGSISTRAYNNIVEMMRTFEFLASHSEDISFTAQFEMESDIKP